MKTKIILFLLTPACWLLAKIAHRAIYSRSALFFLLSFVFYLASGQVPQGFNYQAIARDGSGNPITNATIKVKLSILTDTTGFYVSGGGTYLWEEEQINVKTNAFGLFTVVLGNPLASKVQGSAASFSAIDWAKSPLFIGTKIANPTDYKNLGTAKLWSVPFSMVADSTKALLKGSRLSVVSSNDGATDALFEVKRKDGQTVFAVYPNAVNVYVPRTTPKGVKGGFAIGGFDGNKIDPQDYFRVTPDSVRVYIDKTPNLKGATKGGFAIGGFDQVKGWRHDLLTVSKDSVRIYIDKTPTIGKGATKGGFAIGGFDEGKGESQDLLTVSNDSIRMYINDVPGKGATKGGFAIGGFDQGKGNNNFLKVATEATGIINPSQNRILWYPIKNAFLAGKVLIEKPDSIGENSFASGYESKAKGKYSQALGYKAIARGDYATAIGKNAVANSINSFAFGDSAITSNSQTYAFGYKTLASGLGSLALGYRAKATGQDACAFGSGAEALGLGSYAFGFIGRDSAGISTGSTKALKDYSVAIGSGAQATGIGSFSIGTSTQANKDWSLSMGYYSRAAGYGATSIGYGAKADGEASVGLGSLANAHGDYSIAIGTFNTAGKYSLALGYDVYNIADSAIAIGTSVSTAAMNVIAIGTRSRANGAGAVSIGYETQAIGSLSLAMGYRTYAWGYYSISMGKNSIANGFDALSIGEHNTAYGDNSVAFGAYNKANGPCSTTLGIMTNANGSWSFASGYGTRANSYVCSVFGQWNDSTCMTSTSWNSADPLLIVGNGSSNSSRSNAFTVYKNGNTYVQGYLGVGTSSPTQVLDVNGNARLRSISSGAYLGAVNRTSDGTLTTAISDIRTKDNINTLTNSLNSVMNLRGISFTWKSEPEMGIRIGFIAQEVEKVLPELVFTNPSDGLKGVNYAEMTAVLVEAMKEQQQIIKKQQSEIDHLKSLENEVSELKTLVNTLMENQSGKGNN